MAERDRVKFEVYLYYAKAVGVWMSASSTLCYALFKGFEVAGKAYHLFFRLSWALTISNLVMSGKIGKNDFSFRKYLVVPMVQR